MTLRLEHVTKSRARLSHILNRFSDVASNHPFMGVTADSPQPIITARLSLGVSEQTIVLSNDSVVSKNRPLSIVETCSL
jgi:hypothetical protein